MSDKPTEPGQDQQSPASKPEEARPENAQPEAARPDDSQPEAAAEMHMEPPRRQEPLKEPMPESQGQADTPAETAQPAWGALNSFFNGLSAIGPIALLIILACMAWPMFWQPQAGAFCPAELKSITAFLHCIQQHSWLAPTALDNGAFTLSQWPVFVWWIGLFAFIPGLIDSGLLLPVATFTATFLAVFAVWGLSLTARFGRKAALAGGIILLCAPVFAPLPHFVGPAALAAALMLLALLFFSHGWLSEHAFISLPLAYIFTALAGLCGGPYHFMVPLLASIFFLIWKGSLHRAQRADALAGFILMLAIIGIWLGVISLSDGHNHYLGTLFAGSFHFAWPLPSLWLTAIALGLLGLLPWLLMIFGVSWLHVLTHAGRALGASRHGNGSALLWIALVIAICLAPFTVALHAVAIAIACLAAVLLGKAFINLRPLGNRLFFALASLFMILAGVIVCMAGFHDTQPFIISRLPQIPQMSDLAPRLLSLDTFTILGGICIVAGILGFLFVRRCKASGGLILAAVTVIALCQPARLMLVPEIAAMSGTPLVNYASVEKQVMSALAQPSAVQTEQQPAVEPARKEAARTAPEQAAAQPESVQPAAPAEPAAEHGAAQAPRHDASKADAPKTEAVEEEIVVEEKTEVVPEEKAQPAPGKSAQEKTAVRQPAP